MSRGLGDTQRGLLTALADRDDDGYRWATIDTLATACGISPVQTREAIRSLERGGHVVVTRGHIGWKGRGEYGPLVRRGRGWWTDDHDDLPTAAVAEKGDPWPRSPETHTATARVEFVRMGVPKVGLQVWLPVRHHQCEMESARRIIQMCQEFGRPVDPELWAAAAWEMPESPEAV